MRKERGRLAGTTSRLAWVLVIAAFIVLATASVAMAATYTNHRISGEAPSMGQANDVSNSAAISADGRYVAYASPASDILGYTGLFEDTQGWWDVFRYDRLTGTTVLVSRDRLTNVIGWRGGNADSSNPSISADGRYVAFESDASDLVDGDSGLYTDVFIRDMVDGVTVRMSMTPGLTPTESDGDSQNPSISGDGSRVAFDSFATDIAGGDTNDQRDVFVKSRTTGTVWRVKGRGGVEGNSWSAYPSLSSDGSAVAFVSDADNLVPGDDEGWYDVFYFDVGFSYTTTPVRCSESQYSGEGGNDDSWNPSVSANGQYVAYDTWAGNLDPDDANVYRDVYRWQQGYKDNAIVSVSSSGGDANEDSWYPSISADGMRVSYMSDASNLIASGDNGSYTDIYTRDMNAHTTVRTSLAYTGVNPNGDSAGAKISANGMHVAFSSSAQNIESTDVNGNEDVFVRTERSMMPVWRFLHKKNGSHFYTPNQAERDNVINNLSAIYKYEGVTYQVNSSLSWQPLYRFYNKRNGTHFYTASATERDNVISTLSSTYQYDGPTYAVQTRAGTGNSVWRFYRASLNTHFYTADPVEKAYVENNLSATFKLEGVAFYLPQ